jgi:hypothetical protein
MSAEPALISFTPPDLQAAACKLLKSVAALAAPGSRLYFDFLNRDAITGAKTFPGYNACAEV